MKSNKTGSIILLVMAIIFAVIGTVFIFLEESASPIIVSGTPTAVKPENYQSGLHITFKNNSEKESRRLLHMYNDNQNNDRTPYEYHYR